MTQLQQQLSALINPGVIHKPGTPVLEVADLSVRYGATTALDAVSFQLIQGERLALVGPNGAGKSTLFKVIAGLLPASSGSVHVYGHAPGGHICIAYVPQRSQVDWSFPVTVADVVMMGRTGTIGLLRWPGRKDRQIVQQCLALVGMDDMADRQIGALSGGQQQRVFLARALAQEAHLMLMDEPLAGLDIKSQEDIFRILDELRQLRVTVMVSTHDLNQAAERFDRVMLLHHRLVAVGQGHEVFTLEHLNAAYGGHMRIIGNGTGMSVLADTCCDGATTEEHHSHD